jgi:hypothetical protein
MPALRAKNSQVLHEAVSSGDYRILDIGLEYFNLYFTGKSKGTFSEVKSLGRI